MFNQYLDAILFIQQVCNLLNSVLDNPPNAVEPSRLGQSSFADFSPMSVASTSFDDESESTKHLSTSSTSSSVSTNRKRKLVSSCDESSVGSSKRQLTELVSMETFGNFSLNFENLRMLIIKESNFVKLLSKTEE